MKTSDLELERIARERVIIEGLKELSEKSNDLQENYTPFEICEMMLDKIDLEKAKSILVLYNIELLFALRKRKYIGDVTFFTQSKIKAETAPEIFGGVTVEYIGIEEDPLYFMEAKWPNKFDVVIANPPYGSGTKKIDIKFLDKAVDICKGEIIFVHPSSQYIDTKGKNKEYSQINNKILPFAKQIDIFNGNGLFGIGLFIPCCITHLDKNKCDKKVCVNNLIENRKDVVEDFSEITIWGRRKEFFTLKDKFYKIIEKNKSLHSEGNVLGTRDVPKIKNSNNFFVEFSPIRTGVINNGKIDSKMMLPQFFTFSPEINLVAKKGREPIFRIWFEFEDDIKANNFIKYLKTDFARMGLALSKMNPNLNNGELKSVPWMDFTQEWTDEVLYKHFNITEEEQCFIKEIILPYYDAGGAKVEY